MRTKLSRHAPNLLTYVYRGKLAEYVKKMMGYTHVELLPVMEHPLTVLGLSGDWVLRRPAGMERLTFHGLYDYMHE